MNYINKIYIYILMSYSNTLNFYREWEYIKKT